MAAARVRGPAMADPPGTDGIPADWVTQPDQMSAPARRVLDLFDGERLLRCWRTARGFLVLTDLRCVHVLRRPEILRRGEWIVGPELFFYNCRPAGVLFGRFIEMGERFEDVGAEIRVAVDDPPAVAEAINAALGPGAKAWQARRERTRLQMEARKRQRDAITAAVAEGKAPPVPMVPCDFCGNPVPASARRCPYCGAPRGGAVARGGSALP